MKYSILFKINHVLIAYLNGLEVLIFIVKDILAKIKLLTMEIYVDRNAFLQQKAMIIIIYCSKIYNKIQLSDLIE
jgi:hypothetical protein